MKPLICYKQFSPQHLELQWKPEIAPDTLFAIRQAKAIVERELGSTFHEARIGYHSLSLHFKEGISFQDVVPTIDKLLHNPPKEYHESRKRWRIPVWYNGKDLQQVAATHELSSKELIQLHSAPNYLLHFYGFMPGFMYLGGLAKTLHTPRKAKPDPKIEKGSVAIGGKQTGIYPLESPGGWHIIGKTPINLFDPAASPPLKPEPGDEINFFPIDQEEFDQLSLDAKSAIHYESI
ncbi:allophanate hydrolase [Echinicola pacifica]|uniref:Allophanate hydrolase n=1 Tax=Echinicola pacifica TaxID=346377 RepID=A0A918PMY8_9BACT|nr:5-oxoprolinase subunit PxpB [Echinicola pacifica]GGZ15218.1 allophanate hydrolase [Echinicola pacifica]